MSRIAIATEKTYASKYNPEPWFDDLGLAKALDKLGHDCSIRAWTDNDHNWQQYDAIFVSTTWDGCDTPSEFLGWLELTEQNSTKRLINSYEVLKDGFLKPRYLTKLDKFLKQDKTKPKGFLTPSHFSKHEGSDTNYTSLDELLQGLDKESIWSDSDIILKPCISADGKDTYMYKRNARSLDELGIAHMSEMVLNTEQAEQTYQRLANNSEKAGVIVQPYMQGVENGEYSLTYFENKLSHAIRKPAGFKNSDSQKRVFVEVDDLPTHMLDFANYIVNSFQEIYGVENVARLRIDLFDEAGIPVLCELEAVDPNTNIGVVARSKDSTVIDAIFEAYALAIDKQVRRLLSL